MGFAPFPLSMLQELEEEQRRCGHPYSRRRFVLQCVSRASQRLALTELELATPAFALLNIAMYTLWWDEPRDVQCPSRVRRRRTEQNGEGNSGGIGQDQNQRGSELLDGSGGLSCRDVFGAILNAVVSFASMTGIDDDENDTFFVAIPLIDPSL